MPNHRCICHIPFSRPSTRWLAEPLSITHKPREIEKNSSLEGDTADGETLDAEREIERKTSSEYILSLARGAPNLEELALCSYFPSITHVVSWFSFLHIKYIFSNLQANIAPEMAQFSTLCRFYYRGLFPQNDEALAKNSKTLAEICRGLTVVVDTRQHQVPYIAARISRDENGVVSDVVIGEGYGVQIWA